MNMNRLENGIRVSVANSKINTVKRLATSTIIGSTALVMSVFTHADSSNTTLPVDLAGSHASKHEIAVLQVLSEICPPMLSSKKQGGFYKTYDHELKQLLPTISDPKAAINYLSTQQDYKEILTGMRNWTMSFPREDNLALCNDLAVAQF